MLAKDKTILYIGKATSLKSRVNSYFRGLKNKNRRTMEMLAQVWDIETFECQSPLEAALRETDEIKKWQPPYNILLKSENRTLIFYNDSYSDYSESKDDSFPHGPYKPHDALSMLLMLLKALKNNHAIGFFQEEATPIVLGEAWTLFCNQYGLIANLEHYTLRQFLVIATHFLRGFERFHGKGTFEAWWAQEKKLIPEKDLTPEERVAQKIARLFVRVAETKRKSRQMMRLFNAKLIISKTKQSLHVIHGTIHWESPIPSPSHVSNTTFVIKLSPLIDFYSYLHENLELEANITIPPTGTIDSVLDNDTQPPEPEKEAQNPRPSPLSDKERQTLALNRIALIEKTLNDLRAKIGDKGTIKFQYPKAFIKS